ncbi:hypothetical protein EGT74_17930 [Chitinophaga lutea]|uniref:Uncharacterized protein n=1 Tax=Chitinophaga lutea TaxID=2488634 RepID=A0A3N4PMS2_9BACT|nr:hypothetical protein [Chitinophaga lutea]RPE08898.1 hypothetical protein EGT74_17930 [Chitinophaga lutea]
MKVEQYLIRVTYQGISREIPVKIEFKGEEHKISVDLDGTEICYERDEHDGLRAINHLEDFDPELLYRVGKGILERRP